METPLKLPVEEPRGGPSEFYTVLRLSGRIALGCWGRLVLESPNNPSLIHVVWGHLHFHPIAHGQPYPAFAHPARNSSKHEVLVVELDPEHGSWQNTLDVPFNFDIFFFHNPNKGTTNNSARLRRAECGSNRLQRPHGRLQLTGLSLVPVAIASSPATAATHAAAATTISSTTPATPAAVRTFFARSSDIYRQRAAAQFFAV